MSKALGLIEVIGFVPAIQAADSAVKSANVNILGIEKVTGGIVTVKIIGDVGAVKSAVEAAEISTRSVGTIRGTHIIPRISDEIFDMINRKSVVEEKQEETIEEIIDSDVVEEVKAAKIEEIESQSDFKNVNDDYIVATEDKISEEENIVTELTHDMLVNMSVKEIKKLIRRLKFPLKAQQLKSIKKDELIELVINTLREGDK